MAAAVQEITATPRLIAAVRRTVRIGEVGKMFHSASDLVWAFLRAHPGQFGEGHNIFLYHHPPKRMDPMEVDFGVEVTRRFEDAGDVRCVTVPGGQIATAVHLGPYQALKASHDAIHAWSSANARAIGGMSWEIYGDHDDDPSKLETTICYLLN